MKKLLAGTLTAALVLGLTGCAEPADEPLTEKPVIYLYPEQETTVSVSLDYVGTLTSTYPAYENGWTVTAEPDGTLYDENGDEYSYLFWEGENNTDYDFSTGFCVAGADTADFLREKLAEIGLTPREYNEFIVYWLRKCRITRTTLFRSSPRRTQMPPGWTLTRHRTAFSAYRGSRCTGRRTSSRRHSRRLRETASPLWNGAAAR